MDTLHQVTADIRQQNIFSYTNRNNHIKTSRSQHSHRAHTNATPPASKIIHTYIQGMDKIIDAVVKYTYFSINTELDHHFTVIQLVSFME